MTRVVVLGGSGMLGSMLVRHLTGVDGLEVTATVRTPEAVAPLAELLPGADWQVLDAEQVGETPGWLREADWVLNAIGIIKPFIRDDVADEVERAVRVNSLFPHLLAKWTAGTGRVVQIATDCVYSGRQSGYREGAAHDALDVYGKSKSLGEVTAEHVLHLRCSIIGPEPQGQRSLLEWFLQQPQEAELGGFTNHRWNGVTTLQFARLCEGLVTGRASVSGRRHVVPADTVDKYELLQLFRKLYGRDDVRVEPREAGVAVDRTLATDAPDVNETLWKAAGYAAPPTVRDMIAELAASR